MNGAPVLAVADALALTLSGAAVDLTETVLDPTMGSGTTVRVTHWLGRRPIGFDISAEYVEPARRHIDTAKDWAA